MATVVHTLPGQLNYTGVPTITPVSVLGINSTNIVGKTSIPVLPTLTNGQLYLGTGTSVVAVTPTTGSGLNSINGGTINIVSNGAGLTFNVKIDETSSPQLRGLTFDTPVAIPGVNTVTSPTAGNQKNQWTQVLNYDIIVPPIPAPTNPVPIYILNVSNDSVYMVEFEYNRIISATDSGINKEVLYVKSDGSGNVTNSTLSTSSIGTGTELGIATNRRLSTPTIATSIITFNVRLLSLNSKLVGTVTVTKVV